MTTDLKGKTRLSLLRCLAASLSRAKIMELSASGRRTRVTRDVTGPSPFIVGIKAKHPAKKLTERLIAKTRMKEEENIEALKVMEYNHQMDQKTSWILATDEKIKQNTIQRRVDGILQKQKYSLEERRDRLRSLLSMEEEGYISEMISKQETTLEKQARMREKAKKLREKREEERMDLVEKKLDQRWREQCEELRSVEFKFRHNEITRQRSEQLRLKEEKEKRQKEEEAMYAKMWEQDYLTKCQREEMEKVLQIERNKDMLELLNLHTAAKQKEEENLRELRDKEAQFLKEQNELRALEEERQRQEKRQRQEDNRAILDYSLKLKMKKRAREVQEELALDMKILQQMLTETTNETMENLQRKNQMREEIAKYRQYLDEQAQQEREREKEFEAVVTAELEKQWRGRIEQWKKEREARRKLMQEVMETRKKQIEEHKAVILKEQAENEAERQKLLKLFEEHLKRQKEEEEERKRVAIAYQNDLKEQVKYQELNKQIDQQHLDHELTLQKEAEELYKRRVEDAISELKQHTSRSSK